MTEDDDERCERAWAEWLDESVPALHLSDPTDRFELAELLAEAVPVAPHVTDALGISRRALWQTWVRRAELAELRLEVVDDREILAELLAGAVDLAPERSTWLHSWYEYDEHGRRR